MWRKTQEWGDVNLTFSVLLQLCLKCGWFVGFLFDGRKRVRCWKDAEQMGVGAIAKKGGWQERNFKGEQLMREKKSKQLPGKNLPLGLPLSKEAGGTWRRLFGWALEGDPAGFLPTFFLLAMEVVGEAGLEWKTEASSVIVTSSLWLKREISWSVVRVAISCLRTWSVEPFLTNKKRSWGKAEVEVGTKFWNCILFQTSWISSANSFFIYLILISHFKWLLSECFSCDEGKAHCAMYSWVLEYRKNTCSG